MTANLRAGPSTGYAVVGGLRPGAQVRIVGTNSNGTWYQLAQSGSPWIYAPLVDVIQSSNARQLAFHSSADTTIRQDEPSSNFGSESVCFGDGDDPPGSGADSSVLMRWDLSSIPSDSRVDAASIVLYVVDESDEVYPLYAVTRNWSEQSATWRNYRNDASWQQNGATGSNDRGSSSIGVLNRPSVGYVRIELNAAGVAQVQQWIDQSATNHGVVLANSSAINGVDFLCSESDNAGRRPVLELVVTP